MTHETKHFTMLSTQLGVRPGETYPVVFEEGKTYAIDASLAAQFASLDAVRASEAEPEEPAAHGENPAEDANWVEPQAETEAETEAPAAKKAKAK